MNILSCTNESITVISYNIRYDNKLDEKNSWSVRKKGVVRIFEKYSPSFIGIQEGLVHQVRYIDHALTEYDYIGVGRGDGMEKGEFCAIYYDSVSYKIIDSSTFWLSNTPRKVSIGWDAALERICTYGLFEHKDDKNKIWVFNTHFDHMGEIARRKSSKLILEKINSLNNFSGSIILMGDFNALPNSNTIQNLNNKLDDAIKLTKSDHTGPVGTYNGFKIDEPISKKIDYIFVKNMKVLSHQHLDSRLKNGDHISDHFPVIIDARIEL